MGKFDLGNSVTEGDIAQLEEAQGLRDNVVTRSFRGGVYGAGSQLASLGGLAADAVGLAEPAASLREQSASLRTQAALPQNAPRVASYRDVGSLRDAGEYVGGLLGGSIPYMGVGLAGGLATGGAGVIPGMLGAAAALTPFEAGDVVQKQEADPVAMRAGSGERLRDALVAGGASALAQGVVPGGLAGRVAGKVVGKTLSSIPGNAAAEFVAEGAGEGIKQLGANINAPLNTDAILENAIGGAVAGGAMGAGGSVVEGVRGVAPSIGSTINERAAAAKAKLMPPETEPAPETATTKVRTAMDDLRDLAARGKEKFDDSVDRVINGQPLGDLKEFATAQGDRLSEMVNLSENETVRKVTDWGKEMMNDAGLTPERRQAVADAMANVTDRASQVTIATAKKAWDAAREAAGKVDAFYETFKKRDIEGEVVDVTNALPAPKKSEDYSGAVAAIVKDIVPILQKNQPALLEKADSINKLADGLRMALAEIQKGPLSSDRIASLIDVLGPDTAEVLTKMQERFVTGDPAKTEAFFKQINDIVETQKRGNDLNELVSKSLTPEMQESLPANEIPKIVTGLLEFMGRDKGGPEQASFFDGVFRKEMERYFGPNADKVSKALEKEVLGNQREEDSAESHVDENGDMIESDSGTPRGQGPLYDEQGTRIERIMEDAKVYGLTAPDKKGNSKSRRNGRAMLAPEIAAARGEKSYAKQHMLDLQKQFPQHRVYFRRLPGSEYGHVVVKPNDASGRFNDTEISDMKLDTGRFSDSPNRLDVKGEVLDTVRITKAMGKQSSKDFEPPQGTSRAQWLADMFKQGIAQLTEQFGEAIEVPDTAVIGYVGNKPLTWGEAQRVVTNTAEDRLNGNRTPDEATARLNELREIYARATWSDRRLQAAAMTRQQLSEKQLKAVMKEAKEITDSMERDKVREMLQADDTPASPRARSARRQDASRENGFEADPYEERNANFDEDGNLTAAGLQTLLAGDAHGGIDVAAPSKSLHELDRVGTDSGQGRTEVGKDENIHLVSAAMDDNELINRSNMDGSPHDGTDSYVSKTEQTARNMMIAKAGEWARMPSAAAKKIAERARRLIGVFHAMSEADRRRFTDLKESSPAEAAETVNNLARKYKDAVVAPGEKATDLVPDKGAIQKNPVRFENGKNLFPNGKATTESLLLRDLDYLNNPPDNYTTERAREIVEDARRDLGIISDKKSAAAEDARVLLRQIIKKGESVLEGDASLAEKEGTPDPKAVAAKKAAFLAKAASGDKGLLGELKKSTDAKGLQRAAGLLASRIQDAVDRLSGRQKFADGVNEYNAAVGTLSVLAGNGVPMEQIQTHPMFTDAIQKLVAKILTGSQDARQFADKLRNVEDQIASLSKAKKTEAKVQNDLVRGGATLGQLMRHISEADDVPAHFKVVAAAVSKVARTVPVRLVSGLEAMGTFNTTKGDIKIDNNGRTKTSTVLHEGVHAATVRAMATDPELHKAVYSLMAHVRKQDPGLRDAYGMTTSLEFLAEAMSNEGFQARLKKIPASNAVAKWLGENVANAWDAFVVMVRKALQLGPDEHSALSQVMELTGYAMKAVGKDGLGVKSSPEALGAFMDNPVIPLTKAGKLIDAIQALMPGNKQLQDYLRDIEHHALNAGGISHADAVTLASIPEVYKEIVQEGEQPTAEWVIGIMESLRKQNDQTLVPSKLGGLNKTLDTVNARLRELVQDPDVAYGLQTKKYSQQSTGATAHTQAQRDSVKAYLDRVLGTSVRRAWANLTHAGEFDSVTNVIRISIHALNPLSVAHHEALHAFFKQLRDQGATDITEAVMKAANSPHVIAQLQAFFANEPGVLGQLSDPEERAAYMYQLWAAKVPGFTIGPQVKTRFQKIAKFIREVLGIWSNDERALHILEYFNSGEYAKAMGSPNAVYRALMVPGTNQAVETLKKLTTPLLELAEALVATGSGRVRDTGIPALRELADLIKREATDEGGDQGFIQAARVEATKRRTAMAEALSAFTPEQLQDAQNALQNNVPATTPEGRMAVREIKAMLRRTLRYMKEGGVDLGDLGPDYYPRVWDIHYISKNLPAFREMLNKYHRMGLLQGDPDNVIAKLMSREGNEFGIETRKPGMQHKKERLLNFITPVDAAEFVTKDLFGTLNSYITQAARRTEWERRLGNGRLEALLGRAKIEGATDKQLEMTDEYLRGVDGTLGDSLNPQARRLMGNMIVYQNIRLLPLAVFSSVVDPMGVIVRGGTMQDAWATFKRGIREIPQSYGKDAAPDEMARLAELVGVVDTAILNHTMGDLYTQGMVGGTAQKINNAFFRLNLMEGLNRSFRIGATEAAMKFMQTHVSGPSPHSARWLNELGLRPGDIKAGTNGRMALSESEGLTTEQVVRVHAAINQWVDGAVLRPDAADKPIWMNDPHFALISHLKQFTYAFQKTIIGRVVHEFEQGNLKPAMALANYVPIMIGVDFIKGLLQGGGDQPEWKKGWGASEYIGHGIQRAGLLGVGQFGWDAADDLQRGGIGAGALVGPTIEQMVDAVQVLGGSKEFAPVLMKALPANALYKDSVGDPSDPS